jgi:hypothetical protein
MVRVLPSRAIGGCRTRMSSTNDLDDAVSAWEAGSLTHLEFVMRTLTGLQTLSPEERPSALERLSAHANEGVRDAASECRGFLQHEALSKDLRHIREISPLRPGVRLALFGGYDYYASEGRPWWLNGRECYRATFLRFASRGDDAIPAALVEFDEVIDVAPHKGRYGVLLASYSSNSVAWSQTEDNVVVYAAEALPEDASAFRFDRRTPDPIETHATYRIEESR